MSNKVKIGQSSSSYVKVGEVCQLGQAAQSRSKKVKVGQCWSNYINVGNVGQIRSNFLKVVQRRSK